jgi:hypothetical protein
MNQLINFERIKNHPAAVAARRGAARKSAIKTTIVIEPKKVPTTRAELIAEIQSRLSTTEIADAIAATFGPYSINNLHAACLRQLLNAIR